MRTIGRCFFLVMIVACALRTFGQIPSKVLQDMVRAHSLILRKIENASPDVKQKAQEIPPVSKEDVQQITTQQSGL